MQKLDMAVSMRPIILLRQMDFAMTMVRELIDMLRKYMLHRLQKCQANTIFSLALYEYVIKCYELKRFATAVFFIVFFFISLQHS